MKKQKFTNFLRAWAYPLQARVGSAFENYFTLDSYCGNRKRMADVILYMSIRFAFTASAIRTHFISLCQSFFSIMEQLTLLQGVYPAFAG
jgi:hypothetical protein